MKKGLFLFAVVVSFIFASCSSNDHNGGVFSDPDVEARAKQLGYEDAVEYEQAVADACAQGNHENCDPLSDGTHQACAYVEHDGTNHDGTHHNGLAHNHAGHDANGNHNGNHGGNHHN